MHSWLLGQLGEDAVLVFANAQRFWNDPQVAQAIWNLRDVFKANGRTLTLLTTPGAVLPDEPPKMCLCSTNRCRRLRTCPAF